MMRSRKKLMFVGSFLSKKRGTQSVAEKISSFLSKYYDVKLVSHKENQVLRLLDIIYTLIVKEYDVAHIDVFSGKAFVISEVASWIVKKRSKKIIMTLHGGRLNEFYAMNKSRFHKLISQADMILSPSMFLVDTFKKVSIEVQYLPNFINIKEFEYNGNKDRKLALLWVRAFTDVYHPELAVETLKELKSDFPDLVMNMIGPDKGTLHKVKARVQELDLTESINFLGKIPNEELSSYYQSHAIYLNTTRYESFGIAVVEAAACGIPIVSVSVGEIPYLWRDKKDIFIVSYRNGKDMSHAVKEILNVESLAADLSKNARQKAERLDWKEVEGQWIKLIEEVFSQERNNDL